MVRVDGSGVVVLTVATNVPEYVLVIAAFDVERK